MYIYTYIYTLYIYIYISLYYDPAIFPSGEMPSDLFYVA